MDQAVSAFVSGHHVETKGETPVPPCIVAGGEESCQIIVEAEDKGTKAALLKISADAVRISIVSNASHEQAHNEILKLFGKVLGCRSMQLTVTKGRTTRHKIVSVQGLSIQEVPPATSDSHTSDTECRCTTSYKQRSLQRRFDRSAPSVKS